MDRPSDDELVDIVDDEGRTVATVTRAEIRARRLPHRCAYLLVFNRRGELFIHLRTATKDVFPSHWDVTVGGVLAAGEQFDDGARREAGEELGVDVELQRLFPFRYSDASSVVFGMVYRVVHDGPFRLQPEEIVRGEFVLPAAVAEFISRQPFCPDGLAVYEEYLRRIEGLRTRRTNS
jgi:isopentenyldiphosphate isomerase